ncbi:MAG: hypothetical protein KA436_12900, partial [Oligoflexales bacterium]|nr:hypothetical protein [Oligoflexales bacterium]
MFNTSSRSWGITGRICIERDIANLTKEALQASKQKIKDQIRALEVSWLDRLTQYTGAAIRGATSPESVRFGGIGGAAGLLVSEYLRGPLAKIKGLFLGMKINGAVDAVIAKHGELKDPEWGDQKALLSTPAGRRELESDLMREQRVKFMESQSPELKHRELVNKIGAAAPFVGAMVVASVFAAVGVERLALVSNAQKEFVTRYQKLYSDAQIIKVNYQKSLSELLTGNCNIA